MHELFFPHPLHPLRSLGSSLHFLELISILEVIYAACKARTLVVMIPAGHSGSNRLGAIYGWSSQENNEKDTKTVCWAIMYRALLVVGWIGESIGGDMSLVVVADSLYSNGPHFSTQGSFLSPSLSWPIIVPWGRNKWTHPLYIWVLEWLLNLFGPLFSG